MDKRICVVGCDLGPGPMAYLREQFPEAEDMYLICGGSNNISGLENYLPGLEEMFRQDAMLPEESVVIYYVRF